MDEDGNDIGLHVEGRQMNGRTDGNFTDYQSFSHPKVAMFFTIDLIHDTRQFACALGSKIIIII